VRTGDADWRRVAGRRRVKLIGEEEIDEIVERARALGTDYAVLSDILRLMAEVRRLRVPVAAAERLYAERPRLEDADRLATQRRAGVVEAEAELEATLEKALVGESSTA
jgi:hypothetical protein